MSTTPTPSPELIKLDPSIFDADLYLPIGKSLKEAKEVAHAVSAVSKKITYQAALTTLINGYGLSVRDVSQAYGVLLARSLPLGEEGLVEGVYLTPEAEDGFYKCIRIRYSNGQQYMLSGSAPFTKDRAISNVRALLSDSKERCRDPDQDRQDYADSCTYLMTWALENPGTSSAIACAKILLSGYNGTAYKYSQLDVDRLDGELRENALRVIRLSWRVHDEPHMIVDGGPEAFERLKLAFPYCYSELSFERALLSGVRCERYECPDCGNEETRVAFPDHLQEARAKFEVTCSTYLDSWDDEVAEKHERGSGGRMKLVDTGYFEPTYPKPRW